MTEDLNGRAGSGRDVALVSPGDHAASRADAMDARIGALEQANGAITRALESARHAQSLFLAALLVVMTGFVAVTIIFGLSVSGGLRALNTRVDMDIQARASEQAAADSRFDRFLENTRPGRASQIAPAYALPPLRPHS